VKGQHYADAIRRVVRQARAEAEASAPAAAPPDQERLVSAVAEALRARARRRVLARRAVAAAVTTFAAAAAVALVAGTPWRSAGAPGEPMVAAPARADRALTVAGADDGAGALAPGAGPVALRRGMAVAAGLTLRAPAAGEVRVATADGTSLALEAGGELTVAESGATQRFALRAGAVTARVSRQFAGERFIVDTSDAEVEVHGTAFRVAVVPGVAGCGGGTTTRVSVLEGVVRVRAGGREATVARGGVWPEGCAVTAANDHVVERPRLMVASLRAHAARARAADRIIEAAPEQPAPQIATVTAPAAPAPAAPVASGEHAPAAAPAPPASSLGAENDLFAAAVRAKKQGRASESARLFGELVSAHPSSPLVESAMAQRMKVLAAVDAAAGARAAAAYLERFPGGFAAPEARALADASP
jgi:hypothetical protein